jgi:hypothetical protein
MIEILKSARLAWLPGLTLVEMPNGAGSRTTSTIALLADAVTEQMIVVALIHKSCPNRSQPDDPHLRLLTL